MLNPVAAAQAAEPAAVGAGPALAIAGGSIAALLVLIMGLRLQPMIALLLVSLATALTLGVPINEVMETLTTGFGATLAEVALLVALGAMLGRMLEVSGGAQVLAETLVRRFGEKHAPFALGVAAMLFGFPIFLDAGVIIFLPILFSVARKLGGSLLRYGLPVAGAFAVMHGFMPPHPGPVAAAGLLGADVGLLMLLGLVVAIPTWLISSYAFGLWMGNRKWLAIPAGLLTGEDEDSDTAANRPSMAAVIGILLIPFVLIALNTSLTTLVESGVLSDEGVGVQTAVLVGESPIALVIAVLVACVLFGSLRGMRANEIEKNLTDCLGPIAAVILVTGAGGMFGAVLEEGGVGQALAQTLNGLGIPLILAAFLIAVVMRVAQGSATVALTTAGGFIAPAVSAAEGLSAADLCLIVLAIAAGATVLSHVNDSGFWLIGRLFGMDVPTTLRTWTVMETLIGVVGFLIAWGLSLVL